MERAFNCAQKYVLDDRARNISLNFSSRLISYTGSDRKVHVIDMDKIPNPASFEEKKNLRELKALMGDIQESLQARGIFPSSKPGIASNRPLGAPEPLRKTTLPWIAQHARSAQDFFAKGGLTALEAHLQGKEPLGDKARGKIEAADAFIDHFQRELEKKRQKLIDEIGKPEIRRSKRRVMENQIAFIQEQLAKLSRIDRKAIFYCVAHLPQGSAKKLDDQERSKRAESIRQGMQADLMQSKQRFTEGALWWKSPVREADIVEYARDVGDLLFHGKEDYEEQLAEDDQRVRKGTCIEECVVYVIEHLLGEREFQEAEALSSLGLPDEAQTKELFQDAFRKAKCAALEKLPKAKKE
jgi:hypothetical protein